VSPDLINLSKTLQLNESLACGGLGELRDESTFFFGPTAYVKVCLTRGSIPTTSSHLSDPLRHEFSYLLKLWSVGIGVRG
jgi:hypothetical protein